VTDRENIDKHQFFTPSLCIHQSIWEDPAWNCWSRDQVDKYVRISSAREWLMSGTSCHQLPSDIAMSSSVNMFKNRLYDHWNDVGVKT